MSNQIENRKLIIQALHDEFVGPAPCGAEIDFSKELSFDNVNDLYKPCRQKGSGEEIITRESPQIRYTAGVLFPADINQRPEQTNLNFESKESAEQQEEADPTDERLPNPLTREASAQIEKIEKSLSSSSDRSDIPDFDISLSNNYRPSSAAISFVAHVGEESVMNVEFTAGRYKKKDVSFGSKKNTWWLRTPVEYAVDFDLDRASGTKKIKLNGHGEHPKHLGDIKISVDAFSRPAPNNEPSSRLITVCVVNRSTTGGAVREHSLFQSSFRVKVTGRGSDFNIMPYPRSSTSKMDEEEAALDLLYRKQETFAVGHGCSADWGAVREDNRVEWVKSECFPTAEIPNITPEITPPDGGNFLIPMSSLAGLNPDDDGFEALNRLIEMYENWINGKDEESSDLAPNYRLSAEKHIQQCRAFLARMKSGLEHLKGEPLSMRAFRLANQAILAQQLRSTRSSRIPEYDAKDKRLVFNDPFPAIDELNPHEGRGNWRPFQIAFILATVQSIVNGNDPDREIVDLIWFPTGGGKTEAYLGLAAFSILLRRLKDPADYGVEVVMRYTLRLLTAQQFLRASGLVCALENLRRKHPDELGQHEISIGIWLGGETTPNTRQDAITEHRKLRVGKRTDNPFMVERCPWCGALMGPLEHSTRSTKGAPKLLGYEQVGNTIKFRCPDQACDFAGGLPFKVVDEDIYEEPPSLIIGTVDKFAQLSWNAKARSIFGIDRKGGRFLSPPRLIIQDELHLISGPLGSMVGLYESLVEELCTDRRSGEPIKPKIVCSTATIRRSADQIKALFGRSQSALFPPPGIEAGESFFASLARDVDGRLLAGKIYLGIHTPSAGSFDTTVAQSFASLLQAPMALPKDERDPWWTLVTFYNTLRELGSGLTLLQSHVPDHIRGILSRSNLTSSSMRQFWNPQELTGRLKSGEVAKSIGKLEVEVSDSKESHPVDVCLTSSIMEVGVDIDRLSLMMVVGQPKSTSQYIQITGRVGRNWREKPGLIVTIHPPTRPRDRSHFEKFRSYHERLYAQVEPTSVTPFSSPALERALHAIMAGYALQLGDEDVVASPYPFPKDLVENMKEMLLERVSTVNPTEKASFLKVFERRAREWSRWERTKWTGTMDSEEAPLLRMAGAYINPAFAKISWPTPTSMRNVDAECQTDVYLGGLTEEAV
ncbi:MAG: helicase-related protein [Desulfomonilaceae bacterium]